MEKKMDKVMFTMVVIINVKLVMDILYSKCNLLFGKFIVQLMFNILLINIIIGFFTKICYFINIYIY